MYKCEKCNSELTEGVTDLFMIRNIPCLKCISGCNNEYYFQNDIADSIFDIYKMEGNYNDLIKQFSTGKGT